MLAFPSRAGFGESSRQEGRTVASAAADAAALADHLGHERFLTAGWSGGGPHALACAALLPDRVRAAATIAGVAPYDAEGLDWTAGMGEDNQVEYPTAARDPDELFDWMEPHAEAMATIEADEIVAEMAFADVRRRRGAGHRGVRRNLAASFRSRVPPRALGMVRRRPRVRPRLGVRPDRDPRARVDLAGTRRT